MRIYEDKADLYDLIYQTKDYKRESNFILDFVKKKSPKSLTLLDVGCGTATHLSFFSKYFKTTGVDASKKILHIAKNKCPKTAFQQAKMTIFKFQSKFDVITCLYSVFNYNLTFLSAEKTLRNIKEHLAYEGLVIIALYVPQNITEAISVDKGNDGCRKVLKINRFELDNKTGIEKSQFYILINERGKYSFFTDHHELRIYSISEMKWLLQKNGFKILEVFDNFKQKKANSRTKFPVFIAKKD